MSDLFFRCTVADFTEAMDDAAEVFFLPLKDIHPEEDFGPGSIRKGLQMFLAYILESFKQVEHIQTKTRIFVKKPYSITTEDET